ncbi:uncharacterized protein LOC135804559 [Sycon ciliatum]|uniref:uncharacterized protein LOC135804559 n=1 Tax=Sycon ciliatum TaxID=27933 RepID=UPI0031F6B9D2
MEARLPDDKPTDLRELLSELSRCTQTTQRKLDHFLGKLSFASSVVVPGRTFTRRLWDINKRFSRAKPYFRITLTGIPAAGTIGTASPGHCNPPPSPGLMQEVADLAAMAIAPTTRRTYATGERKFTQFCALQRWTPMPATDTMRSCFAAHLTQSVQPQTMHVYMAAVRNMHLEAGFRDPTRNALLPPRVMRGIKRTATDPAIQRTRLPITIDLLRKLLNQLSLDQRRHQQDKGMLKAAMVLAFFGFLRCAEFTAPPAGFDPATHATRQDVTLDVTQGRTYIRFHIKQSKTDQFVRAMQIVGSTTSQPCPVAALLAYFTVCPSDATDALFRYRPGRPLTRQALTEELRQLLPLTGTPNSRDYAGHSFRIGAATTAAMAGTPDWLIRAMG